MNIDNIQDQFSKYQELFDARPERERATVLACLIFLLIFLWYNLIETPLLTRHQALDNPAKLAQEKMKTIQQQYEKIKFLDESPDTETRQQDAITQAELQTINTNPLLASKQIISTDQAPIEITRPFKEDPAIILNSVQELSASTANLQKSQLVNTQIQTFQIDFHGNYNSTYHYLNQLETLPWFVFLRDLEYKVDNYPNAKVKVVLQIPTLQGVTPQ